MSCGVDEVIAVDDLGVTGPGGAILAGISFAVHRSEAVCLVGETGAGKSLAAQALFGLLPPGLRATGALTLADGRCFDLSVPATLRPLWGHDMFLLPQEPAEALDPTARLLGQVAEAVRQPGRARRRLAAGRRLLSLGLDAAAAWRIPAALSGGMAQRGLLAIAAEVSAALLVADEPTKGLDERRRGEVAALLRAQCAGGRGLLVITHDVELPALLDARMLVLHDGAVVEDGPAAAILAAPCHGWTRRLVQAQPSRWPRPAYPAKPAPAVLAARGLCFGWPGGTGLFGPLDFDLRPGSILGVAGPSGAGKSTLCDVLLGLHAPQAGDVLWHDRSLAARSAADRRFDRRSFPRLYQDPGRSFPPHRRLRHVFADLAAVTDDPLGRLPVLLERLRLHPAVLDRRVGEISGGEAQRLGLARALLLRPVALLADEPTSRLDSVTQAEIALLLREKVEREGLAILWISHAEALLEALATDVVRLG